MTIISGCEILLLAVAPFDDQLESLNGEIELAGAN